MMIAVLPRAERRARARRFLFARCAAFALTAFCVAAEDGSSFLKRVEAVNAEASDPGASINTGAPVTLAARPADLSIRFNHFEPRTQVRGVAAHWAFDEGSGYEFRDSTAGNHTAHITGTNWNTTDSGLTRSFRRAGRGAGGSVYLNGTQHLESRAGAPILFTNGVAVSAWIKLDASAARLALTSILRESGGRFDLAFGENGSIIFAVSGRGGGRSRIVGSPPGVVAANKWIHLFATCEAATGALRIYVDGAPAGAENGAAFDLDVPAASEPPHIIIGRGRVPDAPAFKGFIDEVTLHTDVPDAELIRRLYVAGLPKTYAQTRQTIDPERKTWTRYGGNEPVPHPIEADTIFKADFDESFDAQTNTKPATGEPQNRMTPASRAPAYFGGGLDATPESVGVYNLSYRSPITSDAGTIETWFIPTLDPRDQARAKRKIVATLAGANHKLELYSETGRWAARIDSLEDARSSAIVAASEPRSFVYSAPVHLAATWEMKGGRSRLALFINGVEAARADAPAAAPLVFDRSVTIGGADQSAAHGIVDDLRISEGARAVGDICPRGHVGTEAAALDLKDDFSRAPGEPLMLWMHAGDQISWRYSMKAWEDDAKRPGGSGGENACIAQESAAGLRVSSHPDAVGRASSVEAGVSFDELPDGWAGVYVRSPSTITGAFSGRTFAINPRANRMRIAVYEHGRITSQKVLLYDFTLRPQVTYTLTLTAAGDGELRGYIDNQNLISMRDPGATNEAMRSDGYGGLFTDGARARFDDFHFTALTPAREDSRDIQQRFFADGSSAAMRPAVAADAPRAGLNAFRWHKRNGLLPWQRTYKNPQPPGAIFGAADGVARPNESKPWRAEDSANSAVIRLDGTVYYFLRGNPRANDQHGPAQIGALTRPADRFDGVHFDDASRVLRGHDDLVPDECRDGAPGTHRYRQLQINDEGAAYVGAGKIILVAREFRNAVKNHPRFSRLIYGTYNMRERRWDSDVVKTVAWSSQSDPTSCASRFSGIDATPEIVSLRDADTDRYDIYLYHLQRGGWEGSAPLVSGLRYDGGELVLNDARPARRMLINHKGSVYGQRILFDNGIYYLDFNHATTNAKLRQDWPDRYNLAASLHPYGGEWIESADNRDDARPYFARGAEFDFDNAAIWQGAMYKHRGRYYMYFENFHAIEDRDVPYQHYDHLQTGSRVGFATAG